MDNDRNHAPKKGARREMGSEESRWRNLGRDEQEAMSANHRGGYKTKGEGLNLPMQGADGRLR